ncbi:MAG: LamG-like jellyroll fold domain-containing protein [bacterium]
MSTRPSESPLPRGWHEAHFASVLSGSQARGSFRCLLPFLAVALALGFAGNQSCAAPGDIPILNWPRVMSDWLSVEDYGANGSDENDDTAAFQAALNQMMWNAQNWTAKRALFIPAGTYYISATLTTDDGAGGIGTAIYGTGRTTILKWTGAAGGTMFNQGGWPYSWIEGITWDGQGVAAVGVDNRIAVAGQFPTGGRHQNEAFLNFTDSGIRSQGSPSGIMFSEMQYRNCLFVNCNAGILVASFNTYNHRIEQCEFRGCGYGVLQIYWANAYIQECHFENSTYYDVAEWADTVNVSIRRCTSKNSNAFCFGKKLTVQDCVIDGWANTDHAVYFDTSSKAEQIFDTRFLNPPLGAQPPIKADDYSKVMMSNCRLDDSPTGLASGQNLCLVIPPGANGCTLVDADQRFLKDTWPMPTVVKDLVEDYGAANYGDATAAFETGVAEVKALGNGAWLYVPTGLFKLSRTIVLDGSNYVVSGSGQYSMATVGAASGFSGAAFELRNAQNVGLQRMTFWDGLDVRQTSVAGGTSKTCYDALFLELGGTLRLENLPFGATAEIIRLTGNLQVTNSSRAKILGRFVQGPHLLVEGTSAKDGFMGFLSMNGVPQTRPTLEVRNNQDVVVSDFYFEQAFCEALKISGNDGEPAGRVTAGFARAHVWIDVVPDKIEVEVANYQGRVSLFDGSWDQDSYYGGPNNGGGKLLQTGARPVWLTVWGQTSIPLLMDTTSNASVYYSHNGRENNILRMGGTAKIGEAMDDLAQLGRLSLDFGGYASAAQTLDTTPPAAPGGVAVAAHDEAFHLTWNAVGDADLWGYHVYRSVDGGPMMRLNTAMITNTAFDDNTSHAVGAFAYQVMALDTSGNESAGSTVVSVTAAPSFSPAGADPSLIARWSFDEGSGTTLNDSSGKGNDGNLLSAAWSTAGRFGNCLYFDGISAKAVVPDGSWNTDAPKTFVAWYKRDGTDHGGDVFEHCLTGGIVGAFRFFDNGDGMAFVGYDGNNKDTWVTAPGTAAGAWRMVAVTLTQERVNIYQDGVSANAGMPVNGWPEIAGNLYFGARGEVPDNFFKGWIDEVSIYNRALNAAEIQALYQSVPGNPPAGTYVSPQSISISSATGGASIRYTTDGSTPSATVGTVYDGTPVVLDVSTTLKAVAYTSGMADSLVMSGVYTLLPADAKDILSFGPGAVIAGTNIAWTVPFGTDVTVLAPAYTVSPLASPDTNYPSGTVRNFTTPQTYMITAFDLSTKSYAVTVTVAPPPPPPPGGVGTGLIVWLTADAVDTGDASQVRISGSDVFVKQWNDQSGNDNHATQTTAGDQPQYIAGGVGGKPVLRFAQVNDDAGSELKLGDLSAQFPSAGSLFAVATINSDGRYNLFDNRDNGNDTRWVADSWTESSPGVFRSGRVGNGQAGAYASWPQSGSHVFAMESSSSLYRFVIDGTQIGSTGGQYHSGSGQNWTIGDRPGNGQQLNGDIAELILFDRVLSPAEANVVGRYLADKYGVTTEYPPVDPTRPSGLTAVSGDQEIALAWTAFSGADSYVVKRSEVTGGPYTPIITNSANAYLDTGLINGTTYYYVVSAITNLVDETFDSDEVRATPSSVDAGLSTVAASPAAIIANGTDASTVTVTLKDSAGYRVAGKEVTLTSSGPGAVDITPAQTTGVDGVAVFTVHPTTTTPGIYEFNATVTDPAVVITQTAILNTTLTISTTALDVSGSGTNAEILNDGKFIEANHFGPTGIGPVTVNDVLFGTSWAHMTSGWNTGGQWTDWDEQARVPSLTDGTDFGKLMREYIWTGAGNTYVDIPGLTVGHTYRLQWITSSPRGGNISVEGSASVALAPTSQPSSIAPRVFAFTWVATDTTANVLVTRQPGDYGTDNEILFNGYALHDITVPGGTVIMIR